MGFHENMERIALHLKKRLLLYAVIALAIGFIVGLVYKQWFSANKSIVKEAILILAIATIYPSMVQLRVEKMKEAATRAKEVILGLIIVFLVSPLLAIVFSKVISDIQVALGFVASNVVPASSASIGYVLIAEGDIELATVLALLSLFGAFLAIPGYLELYASIVSVNIPVAKIIQILVYTLILPLIAGQITRYLVLRGVSSENEKKKREKQLKHLMQTATILSMLALIALLIAPKASLLAKKPILGVEIIVLQASMLALLLGLVEVVDRALGIDYRSHSAIAFISATKNQSIAAAIAVMALGSKAAIVPALVPVIQAPVAISYLQWLIKRRMEK